MRACVCDVMHIFECRYCGERVLVWLAGFRGGFGALVKAEHISFELVEIAAVVEWAAQDMNVLWSWRGYAYMHVCLYGGTKVINIMWCWGCLSICLFA